MKNFLINLSVFFLLFDTATNVTQAKSFKHFIKKHNSYYPPGSPLTTVTGIADLIAFTGADSILMVDDPMRGGVFNKTNTPPLVVDSGIVFPSNVAGTYWVRNLSEIGYIKPEWFGAIRYNQVYPKDSSTITIGYYVDTNTTTPVVDNTVFIQRALDAANVLTKEVSFVNGYYPFTQLAIPDGLDVHGSVIGNFGKDSGFDGTVLLQLPKVNDDAIVFKSTVSGAYYRITSLHLHDFILRGNNSNTVGNGISFRNWVGLRTNDSTHAILDGVCVVERIVIREFPENGMFCRLGAVPAYIRNINSFFNGGYGIRWDGKVQDKNVVFENCDGDGNTAGAAIRVAGVSRSNISIYNQRSEFRKNAYYGDSTAPFPGASPYTIEIGNFTGTATGPESMVHIYDAYGAAGDANQALDAVILLNVDSDKHAPFIEWSNVGTSVATSGVGNRSVLYDKLHNIRIPKQIYSGSYFRSDTARMSVTGFNNKFVVGDDGVPGTYNISGGGQIWSKGSAPGVFVYEDSAAIKSQQITALTNKGGAFQISSIDSTGAVDTFYNVTKSSTGQASFIDNIVKGGQTFRIRGNGSSNLDLTFDGGTTNTKYWRWQDTVNALKFYALTDSGVQNSEVYQVNRSGATATSVAFYKPLDLTFDGGPANTKYWRWRDTVNALKFYALTDSGVENSEVYQVNRSGATATSIAFYKPITIDSVTNVSGIALGKNMTDTLSSGRFIWESAKTGYAAYLSSPSEQMSFTYGAKRNNTSGTVMFSYDSTGMYLIKQPADTLSNNYEFLVRDTVTSKIRKIAKSYFATGFIKNGTALQPSSNFNISGTGTAGNFVASAASGYSSNINGSLTANNWATKGYVDSVGGIVAAADIVSQTAPGNITNYTAPADGVYNIAGYLNILSIATDAVEFQVTWTDETNTPQTFTFVPQGFSAAIITAGYYPLSNADLKVKSGTTITVKTILSTTGGTVSFNAGASIKRER